MMTRIGSKFPVFPLVVLVMLLLAILVCGGSKSPQQSSSPDGRIALDPSTRTTNVEGSLEQPEVNASPSSNTPSLAHVPSASPPAKGAIGLVNAWAINVREGPGIDFGIAGSARQGEALTVLEANPDSSWLKVQVPGGVTGWVSAQLLTFAPAGDQRARQNVTTQAKPAMPSSTPRLALATASVAPSRQTDDRLTRYQGIVDVLLDSALYSRVYFDHDHDLPNPYRVIAFLREPALQEQPGKGRALQKKEPDVVGIRDGTCDIVIEEELNPSAGTVEADIARNTQCKYLWVDGRLFTLSQPTLFVLVDGQGYAAPSEVREQVGTFKRVVVCRKSEFAEMYRKHYLSLR
jgi:uncharacterized protein YraI